MFLQKRPIIVRCYVEMTAPQPENIPGGAKYFKEGKPTYGGYTKYNKINNNSAKL